MAAPQEVEGGIGITDAESVGLCPWVEFYPGLVDDNDQLESLWLASSSLVEAVNDFGINSLDSDFARIKVRGCSDLVALKFGEGDTDQWTRYATLGMFNVDVQPILNLGHLLDGIVDFNHNGEVVIYRTDGFHDLHIDGNKERPVGVRRCLLSVEGNKVNRFEHPETKQVIPSLTVAGDAVTISYGAIRHGVTYEDEHYSIYIQS